MRSEREYQRLDMGRNWNNRSGLMRITKRCGYKYITEAIEAEYRMNKSQLYTGLIFDRSPSWVKQSLDYIGVEVDLSCDPATSISEKSRKEFVNGYDGVQNKVEYCNEFLSKHPWIKASPVTLERIIYKSKKSVTDEDRKSLNFKAMDEGRAWAYRSDLKKIAKGMGCEYITEAFYKAYCECSIAEEIANKFERTDSWALSVMEYMGLEKRKQGGRHR